MRAPHVRARAHGLRPGEGAGPGRRQGAGWRLRVRVHRDLRAGRPARRRPGGAQPARLQPPRHDERGAHEGPGLRQPPPRQGPGLRPRAGGGRLGQRAGRPARQRHGPGRRPPGRGRGPEDQRRRDGRREHARGRGRADRRRDEGGPGQLDGRHRARPGRRAGHRQRELHAGERHPLPRRPLRQHALGPERDGGQHGQPGEQHGGRVRLQRT
mmetsp:Transcript_15332/g.33545  ORF Transcript_15332/g.33545 Transcript_15332/m.33545 type:complete len:212 (+) Transcript_15332:735-1370(+)